MLRPYFCAYHSYLENMELMRHGCGSGCLGAKKTTRMTMSSAADIKRLNAVLAKVLDGMKPPEDVTVTEWAEKHRKLRHESLQHQCGAAGRSLQGMRRNCEIHGLLCGGNHRGAGYDGERRCQGRRGRYGSERHYDPPCHQHQGLRR